MKLSKFKILLLLADLEIDQAELAKLTGISKQTLSSAINGRECRPKSIGKIAKALGVDVTEIIEQ